MTSRFPIKPVALLAAGRVRRRGSGSVKGLEKLTQLKQLNLENNLDLTKAQIEELQKALPKCEIVSNPTK